MPRRKAATASPPTLARERTRSDSRPPADLARFYSSLPDGRDLPNGSGTVVQGKAVYEAQCTSCHGDNLQGGLGDRLIGGRGTLVNDDATKAPVKTVESYWPYATTLFDYIMRAVPLTAPESLSDDQVYAVCAYILSRANIVGPGATMDAQSLAAIRMPNAGNFIPDRVRKSSRPWPRHRTRGRRWHRPGEACVARIATRAAGCCSRSEDDLARGILGTWLSLPPTIIASRRSLSALDRGRSSPGIHFCAWCGSALPAAREPI